MCMSFLAPPLLLVAAIALAACGGGDDDAGAARIAEFALLQLDELPGDGWVQGPDEERDDDEDAVGLLAAPACRSLRTVAETFGADGADPQAKRSRGFQRAVGLDFVQLGTEVSVYADPVDFAAGEAAARRLLTDSGVVEDCFREGIQLAFAQPDAPPVTLKSVEIIDIVPVIEDSFAFAVGIETEASTEGLTIPLRITFQVHEIVRGRLVGQLEVEQVNTDDLNAELPALARAFAARLLVAQTE